KQAGVKKGTETRSGAISVRLFSQVERSLSGCPALRFGFGRRSLEQPGEGRYEIKAAAGFLDIICLRGFTQTICHTILSDVPADFISELAGDLSIKPHGVSLLDRNLFV